jgi:hypothetical protein
MRMARGDRWRCANADCGCEVHVRVGARAESYSNPSCACGSALKKPYVKPYVTIGDMKEFKTLEKIYAMELA